MLVVFATTARRARVPTDRALALAGLGILVSAYVVHGFFEEKLWPPFGVPLGLALGLAAARDRREARAAGATDGPSGGARRSAP
jgi:hypothetical protein